MKQWEILPFALKLRIVFLTIVMLLLMIVGTYLPPATSTTADGTDPMPLCRTKGCQPGK